MIAYIPEPRNSRLNSDLTENKYGLDILRSRYEVICKSLAEDKTNMKDDIKSLFNTSGHSLKRFSYLLDHCNEDED